MVVEPAKRLHQLASRAGQKRCREWSFVIGVRTLLGVNQRRLNRFPESVLPTLRAITAKNLFVVSLIGAGGGLAIFRLSYVSASRNGVDSRGWRRIGCTDFVVQSVLHGLGTMDGSSSLSTGGSVSPAAIASAESRQELSVLSAPTLWSLLLNERMALIRSLAH